MTEYKYKTEVDGKEVSGTVEAADRDEAIAKIKEEHGEVTVIQWGEDGTEPNATDDNSDGKESE